MRHDTMLVRAESASMQRLLHKGKNIEHEPVECQAGTEVREKNDHHERHDIEHRFLTGIGHGRFGLEEH